MTASTQSDPRQTLLSHVRSLVHAEQSLTSALAATEPLLIRPTSSILNTSPLLPLPSKSQVDTILAMSAAYSTRTSAPPMWNANLPVVGFATPNPLPHQLRGGALGGMQLKLAREELRAKEMRREENMNAKRRKMEQEVKVEDDTAEKEVGEEQERRETEVISNRATSAKKNEMLERQKQSAEVAIDKSGGARKNKEIVNMNLSDSSSEESDED